MKRLACLLTVAIGLLGVGSTQRVYHARIVWSGLGTTSETTVPVLISIASGGRMSPLVSGLHLVIEPQPAGVPQIDWSTNEPSRVKLAAINPNLSIQRLPGDSAYTPPPPFDRISVAPGKALGPSTIFAAIGPPINERVSLPAYTYPTLSVGCEIGFEDGVTFNKSGAVRTSQTVDASDVYVTGPLNNPPITGIFNGCRGEFASARDSTYTLHVPGGGVLIAETYLPNVSVHAWRGAFTAAPQTPGYATIIFQTRDRRIVKALIQNAELNGPYEISTPNHEFEDVTALRGEREFSTPIASHAFKPLRFSARIAYSDPGITTTGPVDELFAAFPLDEQTPFFPSRPTARVAVEPRPYSEPDVTWTYANGDDIEQPLHGALPIPLGSKPGKYTLVARVGPPVSSILKIPVVIYESLVIGCGERSHGVRFSSSGRVERAGSPRESDLYISTTSDRFACGKNAALFFPGGGIFLSNGSDGFHRIANGGYPGPQFPHLQSTAWRNTASKLDTHDWQHVASPCSSRTSMGFFRIDFACRTLPATTLLFHTRDGRAVKLLLLYANGTTIMGGPYDVQDALGHLH